MQYFSQIAPRVCTLVLFISIALCPPRPTSLLLGMNKFLRGLEITFRRDSENFRPRINKKNSVKVFHCCGSVSKCCVFGVEQVIFEVFFVTWNT